MPEVEYQTHDNTPRIAMAVLAVIALLLGLLVMTSAQVSDQRANPDQYLLAQEREAPGLIASAMKKIHQWRTAVRDSDSAVSIHLLRFGRILLIGGWLWFAAAGAGVSIGWGLFIFFMPMVGILFFSSYCWQESKGPWTAVSAGFLLTAIGVGLL